MRIVPPLLAWLTAAALIACSTATEQSLLSQFFAASRLRDTTALQNIATVVFEPATQGIITSFEITSVAPHSNAGESMVKDVSISAPVKLPSGQTAQKALVIRMQRRSGDWIVTAVTDAPSPPGSPSTPRS